MKINQYAHKSRKCPVCGECKTALLYTNRFVDFDQISFFQKYNVVCCDMCGGVYADNIPNQEDFDAYYHKQNKYEQKTAKRERTLHPAYYRAVQLLSLELPDKETCILDIGCGMGYLLSALKKMGYKNISGLDTSRVCAEYVRTELSIPCLEGPFSIFKSEKQKTQYDAVCMFAVLEHLVDTHEAIKTITLLLKTNGLLLICVPNSESFNPAINGPYQEFSTEHINYFCFDSLQNLLGLYGFEIILSDLRSQGAIKCIFRKTGNIRPIVKENKSKSTIEAYMEKSAILNHKLAKMLYPYNNEKIIVWGTGTMTLHLLASGVLCAENIKVFVDSNPHYIKGSFKGIPVIAPDMLSVHTETILISSYDWKNEILNIIRTKLGLKNEVICLS